MKNLDWTALPGMTQSEIASLPPAALADLDAAMKDAEAQIKACRTALAAGLELRYGTRAKEARLAFGKDTGTVRFQDGEFTVVCNQGKTVSWDQPKLMAVLDSIDPEYARKIAKVRVEIEERVLAGLAPDLAARLAAIRTVKPGRASYALEPVEREAA